MSLWFPPKSRSLVAAPRSLYNSQLWQDEVPTRSGEHAPFPVAVQRITTRDSGAEPGACFACCIGSLGLLPIGAVADSDKWQGERVLRGPTCSLPSVRGGQVFDSLGLDAKDAVCQGVSVSIRAISLCTSQPPHCDQKQDGQKMGSLSAVGEADRTARTDGTVNGTLMRLAHRTGELSSGAVSVINDEPAAAEGDEALAHCLHSSIGNQ